MKVRVGRPGTRGFCPGSREVIIRDVFAGNRTPLDLTTPDFFRAVHSALTPGGLYVSNCGDYSSLLGSKTELAGMAEVFDQVAVIADPPMLKGRRYGNMILIGSDASGRGSPESRPAGPGAARWCRPRPLQGRALGPRAFRRHRAPHPGHAARWCR